MTAEQFAAVTKRLEELQDSLDSLQVMIEDVQALLTPCDGQKDGEFCYLTGGHQGPHLSNAGDEWLDDF